MQNTSLTGEVITTPFITENCSNSNVTETWKSIFREDSVGISIVKDDALFDGKCEEYFANKSVGDLVYILYGYTKVKSGENITNIFAEKINATSAYMELMDNVTAIENVSMYLPIESKGSDFLGKYVNVREVGTNESESSDEFNSTFEASGSESWSAGVYGGNISYKFSSGLNTSVLEQDNYGEVISNYSYALFSFTSKAILAVAGSGDGDGCDEDITEGNWSICINQTQNRTNVNSSDCYTDFNYTEVQACGLTCVSNWSIGDWSECTGELQIRIVNDLNSCGNETGKPATNQTCGETCVSDWSDCDEWEPEECPKDEVQERTCTDKNECDSSSLTKSETESCTYESSSSWIFILIILAVVGLILGAVLFLLKMAKKKEEEKVDGGTAPMAESPAQPPIAPAASRPVMRSPLVQRVVKPIQKIIPKPMQKPVASVAPASAIPKLSARPSTQKPSATPAQLVRAPVQKSTVPAKSAAQNASIKKALKEMAAPSKKTVGK